MTSGHEGETVALEADPPILCGIAATIAPNSAGDRHRRCREWSHGRPGGPRLVAKAILRRQPVSRTLVSILHGSTRVPCQPSTVENPRQHEAFRPGSLPYPVETRKTESAWRLFPLQATRGPRCDGRHGLQAGIVRLKSRSLPLPAIRTPGSGFGNFFRRIRHSRRHPLGARSVNGYRAKETPTRHRIDDRVPCSWPRPGASVFTGCRSASA